MERINSISELAAHYMTFFVRGTRDSGEAYMYLSDDAPEALSDLVQNAHSRMLPDDIRYEMIHDALSHFSERDESTVDAMRDSITEIEADCYTRDLIAWLSSHMKRIEYVDNAVEEFGHSDQGLTGDLMQGQQAEKHEVANSVLDSLESAFDEMVA